MKKNICHKQGSAWFVFSRHFFHKIDTVFLCLYQAWTFQSHTPLCSRPSVTLKQVFCTRSSAQVWLTVRVASAIPHRHTLRQRINDIQVLSRYSVDIYQHILICTSRDIREFAFLQSSEVFSSQSKSSIILKSQ